jgi:hypothetical protein
MTTHVQHSAALRGVAGTALSVLLLAACSGGATTTPPADGVSTPASGTTTTAPQATSTTGTSGTIDVCLIITTADVEALFTGSSVTATTLPNDPSACSYSFQPEEEGFDIMARTGDQAAMLWAGNIPPQGDYSIALTGIGSQAMRQPGYPDFVSTTGAVFCEIDTSAGATELYSGTATPDANDQVPDDAATAIAQKLGTLCSKIFAGQ